MKVQLFEAFYQAYKKLFTQEDELDSRLYFTRQEIAANYRTDAAYIGAFFEALHYETAGELVVDLDYEEAGYHLFRLHQPKDGALYVDYQSPGAEYHQSLRLYQLREGGSNLDPISSQLGEIAGLVIQAITVKYPDYEEGKEMGFFVKEGKIDTYIEDQKTYEANRRFIHQVFDYYQTVGSVQEDPWQFPTLELKPPLTFKTIGGQITFRRLRFLRDLDYDVEQDTDIMIDVYQEFTGEEPKEIRVSVDRMNKGWVNILAQTLRERYPEFAEGLELGFFVKESLDEDLEGRLQAIEFIEAVLNAHTTKNQLLFEPPLIIDEELTYFPTCDVSSLQWVEDHTLGAQYADQQINFRYRQRFSAPKVETLFEMPDEFILELAHQLHLRYPEFAESREMGFFVKEGLDAFADNTAEFKILFAFFERYQHDREVVFPPDVAYVTPDQIVPFEIRLVRLFVATGWKKEEPSLRIELQFPQQESGRDTIVHEVGDLGQGVLQAFIQILTPFYPEFFEGSEMGFFVKEHKEPHLNRYEAIMEEFFEYQLAQNIKHHLAAPGELSVPLQIRMEDPYPSQSQAIYVVLKELGLETGRLYLAYDVIYLDSQHEPGSASQWVSATAWLAFAVKAIAPHFPEFFAKYAGFLEGDEMGFFVKEGFRLGKERKKHLRLLSQIIMGEGTLDSFGELDPRYKLPVKVEIITDGDDSQGKTNIQDLTWWQGELYAHYQVLDPGLAPTNISEYATDDFLLQLTQALVKLYPEYGEATEMGFFVKEDIFINDTLVHKIGEFVSQFGTQDFSRFLYELNVEVPLFGTVTFLETTARRGIKTNKVNLVTKVFYRDEKTEDTDDDDYVYIDELDPTQFNYLYTILDQQHPGFMEGSEMGFFLKESKEYWFLITTHNPLERTQMMDWLETHGYTNPTLTRANREATWAINPELEVTFILLEHKKWDWIYTINQTAIKNTPGDHAVDYDLRNGIEGLDAFFEGTEMGFFLNERLDQEIAIKAHTIADLETIERCLNLNLEYLADELPVVIFYNLGTKLQSWFRQTYLNLSDYIPGNWGRKEVSLSELEMYGEAGEMGFFVKEGRNWWQEENEEVVLIANTEADLMRIERLIKNDFSFLRPSGANGAAQRWEPVVIFYEFARPAQATFMHLDTYQRQMAHQQAHPEDEGNSGENWIVHIPEMSLDTLETRMEATEQGFFVKEELKWDDTHYSYGKDFDELVVTVKRYLELIIKPSVSRWGTYWQPVPLNLPVPKVRIFAVTGIYTTLLLKLTKREPDNTGFQPQGCFDLHFRPESWEGQIDRRDGEKQNIASLPYAPLKYIHDYLVQTYPEVIEGAEMGFFVKESKNVDYRDQIEAFVEKYGKLIKEYRNEYDYPTYQEREVLLQVGELQKLVMKLEGGWAESRTKTTYIYYDPPYQGMKNDHLWSLTNAELKRILSAIPARYPEIGEAEEMGFFVKESQYHDPKLYDRIVTMVNSYGKTDYPLCDLPLNAPPNDPTFIYLPLKVFYTDNTFVKGIGKKHGEYYLYLSFNAIRNVKIDVLGADREEMIGDEHETKLVNKHNQVVDITYTCLQEAYPEEMKVVEEGGEMGFFVKEGLRHREARRYNGYNKEINNVFSDSGRIAIELGMINDYEFGSIFYLPRLDAPTWDNHRGFLTWRRNPDWIHPHHTAPDLKTFFLQHLAYVPSIQADFEHPVFIGNSTSNPHGYVPAEIYPQAEAIIAAFKTNVLDPILKDPEFQASLTAYGEGKEMGFFVKEGKFQDQVLDTLHLSISGQQRALDTKLVALALRFYNHHDGALIPLKYKGNSDWIPLTMEPDPDRPDVIRVRWTVREDFDASDLSSTPVLSLSFHNLGVLLDALADTYPLELAALEEAGEMGFFLKESQVPVYEQRLHKLLKLAGTIPMAFTFKDQKFIQSEIGLNSPEKWKITITQLQHHVDHNGFEHLYAAITLEQEGCFALVTRENIVGLFALPVRILKKVDTILAEQYAELLEADEMGFFVKENKQEGDDLVAIITRFVETYGTPDPAGTSDKVDFSCEIMMMEDPSFTKITNLEFNSLTQECYAFYDSAREVYIADERLIHMDTQELQRIKTYLTQFHSEFWEAEEMGFYVKEQDTYQPFLVIKANTPEEKEQLVTYLSPQYKGGAYLGPKREQDRLPVYFIISTADKAYALRSQERLNWRVTYDLKDGWEGLMAYLEASEMGFFVKEAQSSTSKEELIIEYVKTQGPVITFDPPLLVTFAGNPSYDCEVHTLRYAYGRWEAVYINYRDLTDVKTTERVLSDWATDSIDVLYQHLAQYDPEYFEGAEMGFFLKESMTDGIYHEGRNEQLQQILIHIIQKYGTPGRHPILTLPALKITFTDPSWSNPQVYTFGRLEVMENKQVWANYQITIGSQTHQGEGYIKKSDTSWLATVVTAIKGQYPPDPEFEEGLEMGFFVKESSQLKKIYKNQQGVHLQFLRTRLSALWHAGKFDSSQRLVIKIDLPVVVQGMESGLAVLIDDLALAFECRGGSFGIITQHRHNLNGISATRQIKWDQVVDLSPLVEYLTHLETYEESAEMGFFVKESAAEDVNSSLATMHAQKAEWAHKILKVVNAVGTPTTTFPLLITTDNPGMMAYEAKMLAIDLTSKYLKSYHWAQTIGYADCIGMQHTELYYLARPHMDVQGYIHTHFTSSPWGQEHTWGLKALHRGELQEVFEYLYALYPEVCEGEENGFFMKENYHDDMQAAEKWRPLLHQAMLALVPLPPPRPENFGAAHRENKVVDLPCHFETEGEILHQLIVWRNAGGIVHPRLEIYAPSDFQQCSNLHRSYDLHISKLNLAQCLELKRCLDLLEPGLVDSLAEGHELGFFVKESKQDEAAIVNQLFTILDVIQEEDLSGTKITFKNWPLLEQLASLHPEIFPQLFGEDPINPFKTQLYQDQKNRLKGQYTMQVMKVVARHGETDYRAELKLTSTIPPFIGWEDEPVRTYYTKYYLADLSGAVLHQIYNYLYAKYPEILEGQEMGFFLNEGWSDELKETRAAILTWLRLIKRVDFVPPLVVVQNKTHNPYVVHYLQYVSEQEIIVHFTMGGFQSRSVNCLAWPLDNMFDSLQNSEPYQDYLQHREQYEEGGEMGFFMKESLEDTVTQINHAIRTVCDAEGGLDLHLRPINLFGHNPVQNTMKGVREQNGIYFLDYYRGLVITPTPFTVVRSLNIGGWLIFRELETVWAVIREYYPETAEASEMGFFLKEGFDREDNDAKGRYFIVFRIPWRPLATTRYTPAEEFLIQAVFEQLITEGFCSKYATERWWESFRAHGTYAIGIGEKYRIGDDHAPGKDASLYSGFSTEAYTSYPAPEWLAQHNPGQYQAYLDLIETLKEGGEMGFFTKEEA